MQTQKSVVRLFKPFGAASTCISTKKLMNVPESLQESERNKTNLCLFL